MTLIQSQRRGDGAAQARRGVFEAGLAAKIVHQADLEQLAAETAAGRADHARTRPTAWLCHDAPAGGLSQDEWKPSDSLRPKGWGLFGMGGA